jgi:hypothetical protein
MNEATLETRDKPSAAALIASDLSRLTNHRQSLRIPVRAPLHDDVTIADLEGETLWSARLHDVSTGGIGAKCEHGPILDGTYRVRFPLDFKGETQIVHAQMKLAYCLRRGDFDGYRIGFQLLHPDREV